MIGGDSTYAANTRYTILTAQSLSGKFAQATTTLAYLTPTVTNEGNTVVLTMNPRQAPIPDPDPETPARPIRFEDLAYTSNQRAAARGVQSLPTSNPLYQAVLNLPVGAPAPTFNSLSGETHASNAASLRNVANTSATLPLEHFRSNLSASLLPGQPSAAAGASDAAPDAATLPGSTARPVWAQVIGNWQRSSSTSNTAEVRQHTGGLYMGADHLLGGGWRMGGAVGYTDSRARADAVDSKADISNYSLTLYAGKSFEAGAGKLNFLAGGAYTWHDLSTERMVRIGGGTQKLQADYGASTAQLFTELGYAMRVSPALTLEPYAGLTWSDQRIRGFSESGGYAALSGQSQRNALTTTTLGLRGRQDIMLGSISAALRAGLGWRHTFGDVQPSTTMASPAAIRSRPARPSPATRRWSSWAWTATCRAAPRWRWATADSSVRQPRPDRVDDAALEILDRGQRRAQMTKAARSGRLLCFAGSTRDRSAALNLLHQRRRGTLELERDRHRAAAPALDQRGLGQCFHVVVAAPDDQVGLQLADQDLGRVLMERGHHGDTAQRRQQRGAVLHAVERALGALAQAAHGFVGVDRHDQRAAQLGRLIQVGGVPAMQDVEDAIGEHQWPRSGRGVTATQSPRTDLDSKRAVMPDCSGQAPARMISFSLGTSSAVISLR